MAAFVSLLLHLVFMALVGGAGGFSFALIFFGHVWRWVWDGFLQSPWLLEVWRNKPSKWAHYIKIAHLTDYKCHFFVFRKFAIGLQQNLREEDNLSTKDKGPAPNVSFVRMFYCIRNDVRYIHVPYCPGQAPTGVRSSSAKIWGWAITRRRCLNLQLSPRKGPPGCAVSWHGTESTCIVGSSVLRWGQPDGGENLVSCPDSFRKNREGIWQHCHTTVCPA